MNSYIPNRIRQPECCCIHCGKSYKKRENLTKHVNICEFLQKSKKSTIDDEDSLPSYKDLCKIVSQLVKSNNALKKEVEELKASDTSSKKKKKINLIEWLNTREKTTILFDEFIHTIHITKEDISSFIEQPFMESLNDLFSKCIYHIDPTIRPICAFTQKSNTFYIPDTSNIWKELPDDKLIKFLNRIHSKITRVFCDWKTANKKEINESDSLKTKCEKTQIKLMSVIFSEKPTLTKVKTMIYQKIKQDITEYNIEL
jgi:hypothetical protein